MEERGRRGRERKRGGGGRFGLATVGPGEVLERHDLRFLFWGIIVGKKGEGVP